MLDFVNKTISKVFGSKSQSDLKKLDHYPDLVNSSYDELASISNDELRAKTQEFRERIREHISAVDDEMSAIQNEIDNDPEMELQDKEDHYAQIDQLKTDRNQKIEEILEEILPQAFAVVKETARRFMENESLTATATDQDRDLAAMRDHVTISGDSVTYKNTWMAAGAPTTWNMLHYDVQLIGGVVLHQGKIAEMATGEGKTLVATLPIYLNALPGLGVHVVTVNDYLARRDSEWNGPIFEFLGLKVDCIDKHRPNSTERREAYLADITYGTNNEFGFDYLRDNMARNPEDMVQRPHHYAIVDEVDSVLVDDARTPLIISGPTPRGDVHEFQPLKPKVEALVRSQRNLINNLLAEARKNFETDKDAAGLALLRAHRGLPKNKALIKFLGEQGVRSLLQKTENFYMQDQSKDMHKVDAELFFIIDERHNSIELSEKGIELITAANEGTDFFIMPDIGASLVEIDQMNTSDQDKLEAKDQLMRDFAVKSERIHTMNQLLKAYTLFENDVEYIVVDGKVKIVDEQTGRVMEGRRYSDGLHQAIEAKENVKIEAATQTYATVTLQNYFRMYHKLSGMTGTAETEAGEFWDIYKLDVVVIPTNRPIVRADKEDLVYKTKREKYNAIIDEIEVVTKEGRAILVGTTSVEISELLSRMLKLKKIKHNVLNAKMHQREAEIVAEAGQPGGVTIATNMAGRGTDIKLGQGVKEAGGLAIIGSERHESRRIDRQLRGRSGRQGDPGSSQFFVSLEDDLMRLFGSERIARLMDRMGLQEGEVIQHSMITKSIERAQRKVEENNFGIRKKLLEYDDVMNSQREVIYKKRRHALYGERLGLDILNMQYDVCDSIVSEHQPNSDFEGFKLDLIRYFSIECPVTESEFLKEPAEVIVNRSFKATNNHYKAKSKLIYEKAFPILKDIQTNRGSVVENIVVPFSDGNKQVQVIAPLKKCVDTGGKEIITSFEKTTSLAMIDDSWKEHLREMDDLKTSVQNAVYEQKDPLLVYKFESFELFKNMMGNVNKEIVSFLFKGYIPVKDSKEVNEAAAPRRTDYGNMKTNEGERAASGTGYRAGAGQQAQEPQKEQPKPQPIRKEQKVGRNETCPCGSGKKYKNCHGSSAMAKNL